MYNKEHWSYQHFFNAHCNLFYYYYNFFYKTYNKTKCAQKYNRTNVFSALITYPPTVSVHGVHRLWMCGCINPPHPPAH